MNYYVHLCRSEKKLTLTAETEKHTKLKSDKPVLMKMVKQLVKLNRYCFVRRANSNV